MTDKYRKMIHNIFSRVVIVVFFAIGVIIYFTTDQTNNKIQNVGLWVSLGTFSLLYFTVVYAKKNIDFLNEQNILLSKTTNEQVKQDMIRNLTKYTDHLCRGILNPSGQQHGPEENPYMKRMYNRLVNNGFYDGVRAFLGDMVNFPAYGYNEVSSEDNNDFTACYFYGASRFNLSWHEIAGEFQRLCDLMGVESGLENNPNIDHPLNKCAFDMKFFEKVITGEQVILIRKVPDRDRWKAFLKNQGNIEIRVRNDPELPNDCSTTEIELCLKDNEIVCVGKKHIRKKDIQTERF